MPRKKKTETPSVVSETTEVAVESDAKKQFRAFMEAYRVQSPEKYAHKEAEFIKKLNTL
jgi:hypothetical protein